MSDIEFTLEGVEELRNALKDLDNKTEKLYIRRAMRTATKPLQQRMSQLAPVRTGVLSANIKITTKSKKGLFNVGVGWKNPKIAYYGVFVDLGHKTRGGNSHIPPTAFMQRSLKQEQEAIVKMVGKSLAEQLKCSQ